MENTNGIEQNNSVIRRAEITNKSEKPKEGENKTILENVKEYLVGAVDTAIDKILDFEEIDTTSDLKKDENKENFDNAKDYIRNTEDSGMDKIMEINKNIYQENKEMMTETKNQNAENEPKKTDFEKTKEIWQEYEETPADKIMKTTNVQENVPVVDESFQQVLTKQNS
ncbi:hypothetical protein PVAND_016186 [Polypedilum vanderplanki]|uniref:Uncharacterized protein n=1 Tax=Polypedilum vanderplanki TaxID=319348 RepID=A0A9J6BF48_POLVA|nr:hypothetical protein PVAND_016186 [Polypedilum vanderplanki]